MHVLHALLLTGTPEQRALLASAGLRVVPLGASVFLVPECAALTVWVEAQYPGPETGPSRTCRHLSGGLARFAQLLSKSGPVAYVETDYFGGHGQQAATGWTRGQRTLKRSRASHGPINAALRLLGVQASGFGDEFDAVGLGRHRQSSSWLADAIDP